MGAANSVCKSTEVFAPSNSVRKHAKGGHGCAKAGSAVHLAFTGGRSYPDMCSLHLLQDFYDYGDEEGDEQMAQGEQVGASTRHGVVWLQAAPSHGFLPTGNASKECCLLLVQLLLYVRKPRRAVSAIPTSVSAIPTSNHGNHSNCCSRRAHTGRGGSRPQRQLRTGACGRQRRPRRCGHQDHRQPRVCALLPPGKHCWVLPAVAQGRGWR